MVSERMSVAVIVERRPAATRWASHVWRAVEVLPGAPATPPWTVLAEGGGATRYFVAGTSISCKRDRHFCIAAIAGRNWAGSPARS